MANIRKLSKVASIVMALIGLVVVPHLRAAQDEDATKTVNKRVKKSTKDTTSKAATTDTNTTNKSVEKTAGNATNTAKEAKSAPVKTVSESEISAAKAAGKVWVNTASGVYHKGGQWYGATGQGKFMTEQEAKQAGYRAAKSK
jgi:hypothetical protein